MLLPFLPGTYPRVTLSPAPAVSLETLRDALRYHAPGKAFPILLGSEATRTWVQIQASPLPTSVTWDQLVDLSENGGKTLARRVCGNM